MTTSEDIERHLYRAITNNRLGARTHTLDNAIKELGRRGGKRPWEAVGASRETWRRWHLAPDRKNAQRPVKHAPALLAWLRRARLSAEREERLRATKTTTTPAITLQVYSRYENETRTLGPVTLSWGGAGPIVDAYLRDGIEAAAAEFLEAIGSQHFRDWLSPDAHGSSQSYDVTGMDLLRSPSRGAATRDRARRRH